MLQHMEPPSNAIALITSGVVMQSAVELGAGAAPPPRGQPS